MSSSKRARKEGGWGWMVVLGSHVIQLIAAGLMGASGLLVNEFVKEFRGSVSETSWVVSIGPMIAGFMSKFIIRIYIYLKCQIFSV